jgi:hypothetical protein
VSCPHRRWASAARLPRTVRSQTHSVCIT